MLLCLEFKANVVGCSEKNYIINYYASLKRTLSEDSRYPVDQKLCIVALP